MNEERSPWVILSEKDIYENKWITVTEYDVLNPSGGKGIYGKVHFKNFAIGIIPLDDELNTYLVGQYRFPLNAYSWEIPEGGGPVKEDILASAKRELLEETGLTATSWEKILQMHLSNSVSDEYCEIYLARDLSQQTPMPEETEELAIQKVAFSVLYRMVDSGIITDSLTVCAVLKIQLMIYEGKIKLT